MTFFHLDVDRSAIAAVADQLVRSHLGAARNSVYRVTREYELRLEGATKASVKGRLWRAWASDMRPKGKRLAREPAGFIYLNGSENGRTRGAIAAITEGGRVQRSNGGWLAIPLPVAGGRGERRGRTWQNMTPKLWRERNPGMRLRPVPISGGRVLLVTDGNINKRGALRAATERQREKGHHASVPVFLLLPWVDQTARFSVAGVMRNSGARLAEVFAEEQRAIGEVKASV